MKRDIAIIGMSGRFPKSADIYSFWKNLVEEKELLHFFDDEELLARGVKREEITQSNWVKVASMMENPQYFDYPFFKYTLDEAMVMNPQTRVMHQLVWQALEDAGCHPATYHKKIGIFTGANKDLNWSLYSALVEHDNVDALTKSKLINPNFMASLIAFKLNFTGPCYFIDTACSTSLSTAHLACRSLLLNECGIAVVGGIRLISYLDNGYQYMEGSIMSKDGHSRSFDRQSSGTIPCDGAGVVVLKKLEEAIKDRDPIYAVIKSSAMNNDGNRKAGYTMPSVPGQTDCIKLAQKIAGVQAQDITYVETHGTGTKIGDPIEIESLNSAFNHDTKHRCAIGTVKSNMGHADEAAGIAGLIKTALVLKHRTIPASLHFTQANPTIPFAEGPFYVNAKTSPWILEEGKARIAAVSSLGIGGTNVHMILREATPLPQSSPHPQYHLIRYSAKSEKSLEQYEQQLLAFLESNQEEDLARIAYTLQAGRTTFAHGKYLIANRVTDLLEQLKQQSPKMNRRAEKERIAFMFSGQGSQYVKMGKGLYEEHQTFRQIMDQGFAFLQKDQGLDYRKIWLAETSNLIHETQHTQPILFLLEYALARFLMDLGLRPNYLIGHSLGEYVAACLSGVFSFEDGLRLIGKRASLMASMEGGSMLSVGGNYAQMDQQLIAGLALAAVNSPDSFVLSGSDKAVRAVKSRLEKAEITCRLLKTSHAFHSDLMNGMLDAFNNFLNTIELSSPNLPFVSNVTGEWIQPEEATSPEYWAQHVVQPVQFAKGMQFLIEQNHTLFIEVGPGKTLTTFYKQSQDLSKNNAACYSLRHPKELLADGAHWAKFLGQLWTHGLDIDWSTFYQDQVPQKMNLPTYVFDAYELPTKVSVDDHLKLAGQAAPGKKEMEECFYLPLWKQEHFLTQKATGKIETKNCLFFSDGGVFCRKVRQALIDEGKHVIEVKMGVTFEELTNEQIQIDPQDLTHFQQLAATLTQRDFDPQQFLYAWGLEAQQTSEPETYRTFLLHFNCIRSILEGFQLWEGTTKKKFVLFHHQMASVIGNEQNNDLREFENVLLKVLSQENPLLFTSSIDLDVNQPHTRLIQSILTELARDASNMRVAFRNGKRWIPTYAPVFPDTSQPSCLQTNGRYLFVGDFGDTAFFLAQYLLKNYRAQLAFIGPQWSEQGPQLLDRTQKEQQIQLEQRWEILKRGGGQLYCIPCQQLEKAHLSEAVRKAETYLGTIDGIIHDARGSGAGMGTLLAHVEDQAIESHFAPLVNGLLGLQQIFKDRTLDFAIVLSSLSSFLGGITYGSYAAANALMDEILLAKQEPFNHWRCLNLDRISEKGDKWIKGRELVTIFEHAFQFADLPQLIVSKRPIDQPELLHPAKNERPKPKVNIDRTTMKVAFKAPVTETEGELLVLFESMFSMEGIGVEDDFFELGGDSLKGMMLINKISKSFGVKCAIADLFANASITDLAGLIDERQWLQADKEMANELVL